MEHSNLQQQQQQQQQRKPAVSAHAQLWQAGGISQELDLHTSTPATGGFLPGTPSPRPTASYGSMFLGAVNTQAYNLNHGLPMTSPIIMSEADYQGGLNSHFDYASTLMGRSAAVKREADYTGGPAWALPMQQSALLQPVGIVDGSDFDTATSSLSPRSAYFSEPSECGATFSPIPGHEKASASGTSAEYPSVSPTQAKQSPSQSNSTGFQSHVGMGSGTSSSQSVVVGIAPFAEQRYGTNYRSKSAHVRLPWEASVGQTDGMGDIAWHPSIYSSMQPSTQSPYYADFVESFQQSDHGTNAHSSGSNTGAQESTQSRESFRDVQRHWHNRDAHGLNRSADEQAQREAENRVLIEGKEAGLTYKEIRARIGGDVAESTLRGRYRALTKQKKDRVRKPTWTTRDIRLLREVVNQQLDSLDDGHRVTDANQRLTKISWKKVREYIFDHGGSYKFGNSTCKKKWIEIYQRR